MEEEEKNQVEMNKRKFFAEILNIAREFQAREQASFKRRKQRNDGVMVSIKFNYLVSFSFFYAALSVQYSVVCLKLKMYSFVCISIAIIFLLL